MLLLLLSAPSCSTSQALTLRRLSHAVTEACGSIALDRDGWLEPEAVAAAAATVLRERERRRWERFSTCDDIGNTETTFFSQSHTRTRHAAPRARPLPPQ
mmetsp:Transcript_27470/g.85949  ORF Transcript_27470/g.85949 Transcript_27470/m.85949 type:complete len:100 (-) Transcript_27470:1723-2022(-)